MIDAIEYYIDNFGKEAFVTVKKSPIDYVTREELDRLEERIIREAVTAAKDEMLRISLGAKEDKVSQTYVAEPPQELSRQEEEIIDDEIISNLAMSYL